MSYVTVEELAEFMDVTEDARYEYLELAIDAASAAIDEMCGWSFTPDNGAATPTPSARGYVPTHRYYVDVDAFGSTDGLVVKVDRDNDGVYEETLTYGTDYFVTASNGRPYTSIQLCGPSLPVSSYGRPTVEVTATWGWAETPAAVKQATLLLAAKLYDRHKSPNGIYGFDNVDGVVRATGTDPQVKALLKNYRRWVIV